MISLTKEQKEYLSKTVTVLDTFVRPIYIGDGIMEQAKRASKSYYYKPLTLEMMQEAMNIVKETYKLEPTYCWIPYNGRLLRIDITSYEGMKLYNEVYKVFADNWSALSTI